MRIQLYTEGKPVRILQLGVGTYSFGRSSMNSIRVDDRFVSRTHFNIIGYPNRAIVLEDLGSMNGTILNEAKISGAVQLKIGDEIRVGRTQLLVIPEADVSEPVSVSGSEQKSIEIPKTSRVKKTVSILLWLSLIIIVGIGTFILVFTLAMKIGTLSDEEKQNKPNIQQKIQQENKPDIRQEEQAPLT